MKYEGIHWPGDARMTVMFTIHVDGQSLYNRRYIQEQFHMENMDQRER